ncbi:MAG TPA: 50S ribosomal protein L1 [bacterium]|nr:50S ribosomal protein L1 [bacterium]
MKKHGKRYNKSLEKCDAAKMYKLSEAVEFIKGLDKAKFDESVDLAFNLGVDVKQSDQMVRGTVTLPHGTGKSVKVCVFARDANLLSDATKAGAEYAGADDLIEKVKGGWIDFDVVVATPDMMKDLSKLGKVLGPKGLMPSPKAGTVTQDIGRTVKEVKKGKIEYKVDKGANVHVAIGKLSFDAAKLTENGIAVIEAVVKARPSSVKGVYIKKCVVSSTMGPGLKVDLHEHTATV